MNAERAEQKMFIVCSGQGHWEQFKDHQPAISKVVIFARHLVTVSRASQGRRQSHPLQLVCYGLLDLHSQSDCSSQCCLYGWV